MNPFVVVLVVVMMILLLHLLHHHHHHYVRTSRMGKFSVMRCPSSSKITRFTCDGDVMLCTTWKSLLHAACLASILLPQCLILISHLSSLRLSWLTSEENTSSAPSPPPPLCHKAYYGPCTPLSLSLSVCVCVCVVRACVYVLQIQS